MAVASVGGDVIEVTVRVPGLDHRRRAVDGTVYDVITLPGIVLGLLAGCSHDSLVILDG